MLLGKSSEALELCRLTLASSESSSSDDQPQTEAEVVKTEIRFLEGCLSRSLGKISAAICAFENVLKVDPKHSEAHDHIYGATCGLLPYKPRNAEEDALFQAYKNGNYMRLIDMTLDNLWTKWLGDENVMVLLVSSLACTFDSSALYTLGQRSVNQRPDSSVTWYCVGMFYQIINRSDEARRYLFKAGIGSKTKRSGGPDTGIGPAWIALGHSFAAYGDHDQAVSAYVAAVRTYCPGSVEPSLFLAIEYLRVRQPVLAAAYLLDAHAVDSSDPRVLNELACLQAGKGNFVAAKKFLTRALEISAKTFPIHARTVFALNFSVVSVKEVMNDSSADAEGVKIVLDYCAEIVLGPLLNSVNRVVISKNDSNSNSSSAMSLFPWTANSAHPSAEYCFIFTFCVIQEWRALLSSGSKMDKSAKFTEEAIEGYRTLLECRNEHRNLAMEAVLVERLHRLLAAHSTLSAKTSTEKPIEMHRVPVKSADESFSISLKTVTVPVTTTSYRTPRTPLIRSHSLAFMDSLSSGSGSFISSQSLHTPPIASFSAGALPTASALGLGSAASSIAASVSRRRLSLRRQMTGLRFDPADTSASFSSLESDNSFLSTAGIGTTVTSIQINEDLMTTSLIDNQSMILIDSTDVEADCEFIENECKNLQTYQYADDEDMQLDSE